MSRELLVIGTRGLAKEVAQAARHSDPSCARWTRISYVTESAEELGRQLAFGDVRYVDADLASLQTPTDVAIGVGYPGVRRRIAGHLLQNPVLQFPNIVHPRAVVDAGYVTMGQGNVITNGAALTCDITLGDFNLVNLNSTIGHDARIGSFNVINPGCNISGSTTIGDECLLGTGCQILEGLAVASGTVIGAGAVVVRSIDVAGVYAGVPARVLSR